MTQYGMDAARLIEKDTSLSPASVPHWLSRLIASAIASRIHCSTPGLVVAPIDVSRLFIASRTELTVSVTISPEWFTIRVTCPMPKVNSQISRPRKMNRSRRTGISDAGLRFILIFFCRNRITGCSAAAIGIAMIKGDSLSQTSGSTQRSAAYAAARPSSLRNSRSAAFLSSLIRSPPSWPNFLLFYPFPAAFATVP